MMYNNNNLQTPSRKLWQKENGVPESSDNIQFRYLHANRNGMWDAIDSPQFIDFSKVPDTEDKFFNKVTVIVSTPKPNFQNEKRPITVSADKTLAAGLDNLSLSSIKCDTGDITVIKNEQISNKQEVHAEHDAMVKLEPKHEKCDKIKKPLNTLAKPFSFDLREKYKQENKQQRINKILEEEKKMRKFRANPLPKFIKTRTATTHNSIDSNNGKDNGDICNDANNKVQEMKPSNRQIKRNGELWKKPPFAPSLEKKYIRPKTPPLHSLARAQERRRFDEAVREKERQKEELRQMENIAKKKQEEEEVAELRKKAIHKAQPIRKFKLGLPEVQKRPLTDPVTPIMLKRRRRV